MNHIFRLVWNRRLGVLQVASEFARGRTKGGRSAEGGTRRAAWLAGVPLSLPLLALAATPSPGNGTTTAAATATSAVAANALPTGGQVTGGAGHLAQQGNTLTITQQSQNLSLNWQTFNIGSQSSVDFVQPNAGAVAVNRIADTNGSRIFGHLNANGQVFLINPNGILFGQGAQVNVGGLVASTLDVDDSALGSGSLSFRGTGKGRVTNLGTIHVTGGGYAALLGNQVSNQGAIHAQLGSVALAGGSAVTLNFNGDKLVSVRVDQGTLNALAQNGQLIEANGGNVWMTAGARDSLLASAVNNTGTIEAQTVQNRSGHIVLLGGMDAGTVAVGGVLDASAPNGGSGGQIETSAARVNVANNAKITTAALLGLSGTWLIDPNDFTVALSGGDITGAALSTQLSGGNVVIQSSAGGTSGSGNVNVDDTVSWGSNTLTLDAQNNININGTMTASGSAGLALNYGGYNGTTVTTPAAGTSVNVGLGGSGFAGQVNFTGSSTLSINGQGYTLISSATALQNNVGTSGFYALAGNLNLSGGFTPIGTSTTAFSGVFDGLGHTITGLTVAGNSSLTDVGLFGASSGTIRNVGLLGESVSGAASGTSLSLPISIGGLVGDNSGTVSNVFTTGTVSGSGDSENIGGLVGTNESSGTISNAYAMGAVSGSSFGDYLGGLVGTNDGTVSNAYATGAVSGSYGGGAAADYLGGLVGYDTGTIQNAYATGNVSWNSGGTNNNNAIGGLVGLMSAGTIIDTYATGSVSTGDASDQHGGLVGSVTGGTTTASYWDTQSTNQQYGTGGAAATGMTGLDNTQILQQSSFSWTPAISGGSGATWRIYNGYTAPLIESLLIPLTISTSNQTVTYNGTNQDTTVLSYSLPSPNLSAITLGLTAAQHAGGYSENVSSAYSSNYDLSFGATSATLTINPATLTPTLTNSGVTKTYNGTTAAPVGFTPTYSFSGLVPGDTGASLTDTSARYNSAHVVNAANVTVAGLSISGITGSNSSLASDYTLASTSANVAATITRAILTPRLTNINVTKVYNGTTNAPVGFTPTYSYLGLVVGDTGAILTNTGVAYNGVHAGSASRITVSGLRILLVTGSNGSLISDYTLAPNSASVAATITPATLTATLTNSGVSKTYDGTTNAPGGFTPTYSFSGLISGDTRASLSNTGAAYNSAHVIGATSLTLSGLSISSITGSNGSLASDYTLTSSNANGAATITPAPVTASLSNTTNVTKTYDGTTAAPGGFSPTYSVSGLVSGDSATVSSSATPVFNSTHVASATAITQGGLTLASITGNGTDNSVISDYTLASTTASTGAGVASVSPIVLTTTAPTIGGTLTKVYDGTTAAAGASLIGGSVSGALSGDSLSLNATGITLAYNSSHVANASSISASGSLGVNLLSSTNGSQSTDYSLSASTITSVAATITPAPLTLALTNSGVTKSYDGTTSAPVGFTPTYSYLGLVSGDTGASLTDTSATYNSAHVVGATSLTVSGLSISGITGSNGSQASDYSLVSSSANVAASVIPATLTATLTNSGVAKAYDGTTAAPIGFAPTYSYSGLASGDTGASLTDTSVAYNSAHVVSAANVTVSGLSISGITGSDGSLVSDYILASNSANVAATITPAILTATLTNSGVTKTYDGTTNAPGGFTPTYSYSGLVSGDTGASLSNTGAAYDSAHVASATDVTVSGLSISGIAGSNGSQTSDYTLASSSANVAATIMPAPLTVALSNTTNVTKTYDGTTATPGGFSPTYSVSGLVSGDSATVSSSATPTFNSAHVASATVITQGGLSLASITGNGTDNSVLGDYTLVSTTAATGVGVASISPRVLTATAPTIGGFLSKTYDGTTTAMGARLVGGSVSGAISGDSLSLDATGITLAYNSSHVASASSISASGSLGVNILSSTSGSQSTDYSVALPTISSVAGTITPAPLTPVLINSGVTKSYDGTTSAPVGFTPMYSPLVLVPGDTGAILTDTSVAYNSAHVVGATSLTVSGLSITGITGSNGSQVSDYFLVSNSANVAASITPATLTATLTNSGVTKTYDGTTAAPIGFVPTFSYSGLASGDTGASLADTSVAYNSTHVASASRITVSGLSISSIMGSDGSLASDYTLASGSASVAATITPATLTATLTNSGVTKTYDGTTAAPIGFVPTFSYSGLASGDTGASLADTSVAYNSTHVASASRVTVSGLSISSIMGSDGSLASDYTLASGSASVAATITPATLTATLTNSGVTKTYDGTTAAPIGFTPTYNYSGFVSGDTGASLTDTGVAYNSAHVVSASDVTVSGLSISGIVGSNGSQASDYSLVPNSANVAASITPATLTATLTNSGVTKTYDGTTAAPIGFAPTYGYSGLVSGDTSANLSDTGAVYNSAQVANATRVTVSGLIISGISGSNASLASDYTLASGSVSVAATITPATLTASLVGPISKVYDGTTVATLTPIDYTLSGFVSGEGATVTQTSGAYNSSNVANATTVTATLGGSDFMANSGTSLSNYSLPTSASGAASITPALLVVTANNASKTYNGIAYSGGNGVVYSGLVNGENASVLGGTLVYGGTSQGAVNAGFYTITPSGLSSSNYTINYGNGMLTVSPATLTASLTGTVTKVYDGTTAATLASGNYSLTGVIGSDAVSLNDPTSGLYATANAGSGINVQASGLAISGSGVGNYILGNSTAIAAIGMITPARLTITANSANITYNAQSYSGGNGVTYNGFVDGQSTAVLGGALTYGGSSQGALNVGSYTLTPSGLTSNNYAIAYNSGMLTIMPATLTYVATPVQVFAGQTIPTLTGTVTGFQGSDTLANATSGTLTFTTPATAQSPAGEYAIAGHGLAANDGNYTFVQAAGNALAFNVVVNSEVALPGVAYVQQLLGKPAPIGTALAPGSLLVSTMAASDESAPATVPLRSAISAATSDLYAPDIRVVGGGVRLP
ncbi:YDG domain-containing protein [Dyella choica]|uniref:Filamentous hemagglutinin N-terminal domain-containing protein n=1 Tax=Dyella choica TaxID=1927959 RepID=A0A432LZM3_9GAMM|nr:YDG domain-containing protein [Dyella choica]RUL69271.1 filamentous hemagglutinin N-terminal domain-containing protein [Dyella choica]